jgi:hypothetical protein
MIDMVGAEILPNTAGTVAFLVVRRVLLLQTLELLRDQMADVVQALMARLVIRTVLMADVALSMGRFMSQENCFRDVLQAVERILIETG